MRKTGFCVILLAILFSLFTVVSASAEQAVVVGDEVNVRTGPGTAYGIFANLERGTTVEVVNRSNSDWYLVSWAGNSGYVSAQFLEIKEEEHPALYSVDSRTETAGYINGMYVSMRSGPGTSYTILGTYSTGKALTITGSSGEWTAVRIDGTDGFVYRDFVAQGSYNSPSVQNEADIFPENPVLQTGSTEPVPDGQVLLLMDDNEPAADQSLPGSASAQNTQNEDSVSVASVPTTPSETDTPVSAASVPSTPSEGLSVTDVGNTSSNRIGEITANAVRLRSGPGTSYSILGSYDKGTRLSISGISDGWYAVRVDNISGYIHSDYVQEISAENTVASQESVSSQPGAASSSPDPYAFRVTDGYIVGSSVRLRESPSMTARILMELNFGTAVKMTGLSGEWTRVICNGQEGYVSSAFVTEGVFEPATKVSTARGTDLGKEIAAYALNYLGTPYRWGGNSPATGFDCSGFVQYVFSQFGYTTSRIANDVTSDGVHVDPSDLQPGDVLCFYSGNNYVGHVGIYIGDNMFVHAANSSVGVVTTSLSTGYYSSRGYEIRRII